MFYIPCPWTDVHFGLHPPAFWNNYRTVTDLVSGCAGRSWISRPFLLVIVVVSSSSSGRDPLYLVLVGCKQSRGRRG